MWLKMYPIAGSHLSSDEYLGPTIIKNYDDYGNNNRSVVKLNGLLL
jgi:hypothetical protein